jgi:prophage DNA circulation protein
MLNWRSKLIPAEFRKAKFSIISSSRGVGRRNVLHEYPFSDIPFAEDLGKSADTFRVEGFIIQKPPFYNYFKDRDKLIKALAADGAGQLNHPYYGKKQVVLVGQASIDENIQEGGIARFSMTFAEAGIKQSPGQTKGKGLMDDSAWGAINSAINAFEEGWDTAQSVLDDINSGMQQIQSAVLTIRSLPSAVMSRAIQLVSQATALVATVTSTPCALANAIVGGFEGLQFAAGMLEDTFERGITEGCAASGGDPTVSNGADARQTTTTSEDRDSDDLTPDESLGLATASLKMATFGDSPGDSNGNIETIAVNSEISALKRANQLMLIDLMRVCALANACMIGVRANYASYEEAMAMLERVTAVLDSLLVKLGNESGENTLQNNGVAFSNDNVYAATLQMKADYVESMVELGASLSNAKELTIGHDTMSTLLLAYREYGDINRADEILDRNKSLIFHPAFIPGGETISILAE